MLNDTETAQLVIAIIKNARLMTLWDYKTGDARDLSPATRAMFERISDLEEEVRLLKSNQDYYRQCLIGLPRNGPRRLLVDSLPRGWKMSTERNHPYPQTGPNFLTVAKPQSGKTASIIIQMKRSGK